MTSLGVIPDLIRDLLEQADIYVKKIASQRTLKFFEEMRFEAKCDEKPEFTWVNEDFEEHFNKEGRFSKNIKIL